MDRQYLVSIFRDRFSSTRREVWLNPDVLREALDDDDPDSIEQITMNVANAFRRNPQRIIWGLMMFTLIPTFEEENHLGDVGDAQ